MPRDEENGRDYQYEEMETEMAAALQSEVERVATLQREAEILAAAERLIANQKLAEQKAVAAAEAATAAVAAAAIANPVKEAVNLEVAALTEKMARMEALMSRVEKGRIRKFGHGQVLRLPERQAPPSVQDAGFL